MSAPPPSCSVPVEQQLADLRKYVPMTDRQFAWAGAMVQRATRDRLVPYMYPTLDGLTIIRLEFEDGKQPFLVEIDVGEDTVTEFHDTDELATPEPREP